MKWPWAKDWSALATDPGPKVDRTATAGDGFPVSASAASPPPIAMRKQSWSEPPRRGTVDLLAAITLSPMLRSVIELVADAFSVVTWFTGTLEEQTKDHPGILLLKNMNPKLPGMNGRKLMQLHMLSDGNFIAPIAPSSDPKKRFDIYPVPPHLVEMRAGPLGTEYVITMGTERWVFQSWEVLHFKEVDPVNPYGRGKGKGWALGDEIEAFEYQSKHVKAYYFNSSVPEMIFSFKGMSGAKGAETLKEWQETFDEKHRGFAKHWRPVWFNAEVDVIELTRTLGEERVEELRKSWFDIARYVYHVPPEVTGNSEDANRATIKESSQHMGVYVTNPLCVAFQEFWQLEVMNKLYDGAELFYLSPIPKMFDRRDEIMSRHAAHFTRNEVRGEAGFSAVSDGDVYPVPANIAIVDARRTLLEARGDQMLRIVHDDTVAAAAE